MIHLTKANHLKTLARKLAEDLKVTSYYADPFLEDWIVVQNRETQLWLQKEISGINGISANLKFIYPSELGW
ncbi:MAG: exodeoxyribonuclease V subunit gamma, partial [Balneolaceae bacterium]